MSVTRPSSASATRASEFRPKRNPAFRKVRARRRREESMHPGHGHRPRDGQGDRESASRRRPVVERRGAGQHVQRAAPLERHSGGQNVRDEEFWWSKTSRASRWASKTTCGSRAGRSASRATGSRPSGPPEEPFDSILLDVMLPGNDGFDVAGNSRAGVQTPIIMLTAKVKRQKRCSASISAPTTTSPSRSVRKSCAPGFAPLYEEYHKPKQLRGVPVRRHRGRQRAM